MGFFGRGTVRGKLAQEELRLLEESGYSKQAIELYINEVNVGIIERSDVVSAYTGPCGDVIKLYLKIDKNRVVEDARFQYLGCPGSASSASAITNIVKGKTIEEAKRITEEDVLRELGGLPRLKLDCPKLVIAALRKAIAEYEEKT